MTTRPTRSLGIRRRHALAALGFLAFGAAPAGAQETAALLFDRQMTVRAGATVTSTIGDTIARAEDAIVPARLFAERGVARRTANIAYRLSKIAFFDLPQEHWLVVANHEVMGHGARLRERFDGPIRHEIDAPPPYGAGGGATFFSFDRLPASPELLAVSAAGMEADAVAARIVAEDAFGARRLHWRSAIRYLAFELDTLSYVRSTGDALEDERPGHDVAQFLQTYNEMAAAAGVRSLAPRTLRGEVLASLANPMLGVAAVSIGRYVWSGAADTAVPALSFGSVRLLPLMRYQLAPYGTEWAVTNHISGRRWPTRIEARVGRAPGTRPWGVSVDRRDLATVRSWRIDVGADVWRQPNVAARADTAIRPLETGTRIRIRAERPLVSTWFSAKPMTAILEAGLKTPGFVPGEPLDGGLVVRLGIGVNLPGR